ncbi:hypothetical protein [Amycolatopsis sp. NPDC059021]|uniref:hypothetical protein n=1 Tax=Amycolatopsis sp. NPDC059021 TaxID=3346704 RepID=UPI00366B43C7
MTPSEGYIGGSLPTAMTGLSLGVVNEPGRRRTVRGTPKLAVLTHFALGDTVAGRANIQHFHRVVPSETVFVPATDDLDEVTRLADIVA